MARPIDSTQSDICRRLVDLDGDCGGGGLITGCCGDDDDDDDVEVCSETESIHDGRTDGRMDAGAEAGSDRLSCDVRRHCQRRHDLYTCLSIYLSVVSTTPSPELWPPDISMPPRNQATRTSAPPLGLRLSTRSPVAFSEGETKFCGTQIFSVF